MGRKASRELAMKLLYQYEFRTEDKQEQLSDILGLEDLNENDRGYIQNIVQGVSKEIGVIDNIIENNAKGWKISRMSKVDIAILRLAIYEITFRDDIPCSVTINEAVEMAKKFSSKESGAFINGMLGKISNADVSNTKQVLKEDKEQN
jgi:N utilization substance protein B